jgi:DNA-binding winged helix-turn-helix (wHTH) protein
VRFGDFVLDVEQRRLTRNGTDVHLTRMAFNLLALLVAEAPRVVPKQELHERLWPDTFVSEATLLGLVKELRLALEDRQARTTIRTVNRVGYAFGATIDRQVAAGSPRAGATHWLLMNGRQMPLSRGTNLIGRDPDAGIRLDSSNVSRRHAQVVIDDEGARLEDLGSKNGTLLGERPLDGARALRDGDRFTIGGLTLTYRKLLTGATTDTQVS